MLQISPKFKTFSKTYGEHLKFYTCDVDALPDVAAEVGISVSSVQHTPSRTVKLIPVFSLCPLSSSSGVYTFDGAQCHFH